MDATPSFLVCYVVLHVVLATMLVTNLDMEKGPKGPFSLVSRSTHLVVCIQMVMYMPGKGWLDTKRHASYEA